LGSDAKIDAAKATTIKLTNGATASNVVLATPELVNLTVESGADLTLGTNTDLSKVENTIITMNDGKFDSSSYIMEMASNITLAGAGDNSEVVLGNLGKDDEHNIYLNAQGLKGGLTVGTMDVKEGSKISVDATALEGNLKLGNIAGSVAGSVVDIQTSGAGGTVTVGDIGTSSGKAGDVTIDTSGAIGDVEIGAITSSGTVDISLKENLKNSTLGAISGKDVKIDASDAVGTLVIGDKAAGGTNGADITVTDSLIYTAGLKVLMM